MEQFLWGVNEKTRTHWVNQRSFCTLVSEGGLGIRSLDQIQAGLHAKLTWMMLLDHSLWAKIMRAKYFVGNPVVVIHNLSFVAFSRFILSYSSSRWLVGCGDRSFWHDNWMGQILIGVQPVDANISIAQGIANFDDLKHMIPEQLHVSINSVVLAPDQPDKLINTSLE